MPWRSFWECSSVQFLDGRRIGKMCTTVRKAELDSIVETTTYLMEKSHGSFLSARLKPKSRFSSRHMHPSLFPVLFLQPPQTKHGRLHDLCPQPPQNLASIPQRRHHMLTKRDSTPPARQNRQNFQSFNMKIVVWIVFRPVEFTTGTCDTRRAKRRPCGRAGACTCG